MRRIIRSVVSLICLFLAGCILLVVMSIHRLDDAYAQWGAAEMVIDYMADHDGEWPKRNIDAAFQPKHTTISFAIHCGPSPYVLMFG